MFRIDMEAEGVPGGTPGTPNPVVSPETPTTPSPVSQDALEAALKRISDLEAQQRATQSDKDKGIVKVAKEVAEVKEQFARYEEYRKRFEPEEAVRQMQLDAILAERYAVQPGASSTPQPPGSGQVVASEVPAGFLESLGLDANSADVNQVLRETNDFVERVSRFTALAQKARQAPAPNPAAVQVTGSGANASGEDVDTLTARLSALQNEPSKNIVEIKKVSAQLRELLPKK